jgi:hypothetical protein
MFHLVSCCSFYFNDITRPDGPGFILFRLLFLGSGSTFGSTSPHLPPGDSAPLSVGRSLGSEPKKASPGLITITCLTKRMNHRGPRAFWIALARNRSSKSDTETFWTKNGVARNAQQSSSFPPGGSGTRCYFEGGDEFLGISR